MNSGIWALSKQCCIVLKIRKANTARAHCRSRFEIIWTNELAETETASHAADGIQSSPGATGQTALRWRKVNTDQTSVRKLVRNPVFERAGGTAPQPDVNQLQWMCRWINRPHQLLQTTLKAVLVVGGALLDIKMSEQTRCCQLRQ